MRTGIPALFCRCGSGYRARPPRPHIGVKAVGRANVTIPLSRLAFTVFPSLFLGTTDSMQCHCVWMGVSPSFGEQYKVKT